ncbi:MAG: hypothetical protein J0J14_02130 [Hyphomicrobium sp.]|nr:hypothetical protein [Hyphomicrobium sp.]
MTVTLRYFAWLRERVGRSEEVLDVPRDGWPPRAAIDHAHVRQEAPIAGAREIGFFPPVTGG